MSLLPTTEIKGNVILSSDLGSNTTIGNSSSTTTINGICNISTSTGITGTNAVNVGYLNNTLVNFARTDALGLKAPITNASFSGSLALPIGTTIGTGTAATNEYVNGQGFITASTTALTNYAPLTGATFTGTVKAASITSTSATTAMTIGSDLTGAGTLALGTTTSNSTTINGGVIKQVVTCQGGGTVETVIGNSDNVTSLSTTFNRKSSTERVGPFNVPFACYTITLTQLYTSQYFEIIISGSNNGYGGYCYKGNFVLTDASTTVTTLFSSRDNPVITFNVVSGVITLSINAAIGNSTNQNFISTLIAYPTLTIDNNLNDFSIVAI